MALADRYGNVLTSASQDAVGFYCEGLDRLLSANVGAVDCFSNAVEADPLFALGHSALARAKMLAGDMAGAKTSIGQAVEQSGNCSEREQQHIKIFELLFAGNSSQSRSLAEKHLSIFPRDAIVASLCTSVFGLIAFSGCHATEAQMLGLTSWLTPHYKDDWWMQSMHAMALCESGQPEKSLGLMEQSLAVNPRNAHGSHFKAHALYEMNQATAGIDYLNDWLKDYDRDGQLHSHLNWHLALWSLSIGDTDRMWAIVDGAVGPEVSKGLPINIVTDMAAIYFRAELAGQTVPSERWQKLAAYIARKFPNPGQSFVDIHAALAHAMAGNADDLAKYTDQPKGFASDLVRPIAQAWQGIVRQNWQESLDALTPVMRQHSRLGGSRAQRDLIEFTYLSVLLKLGRSDEAKRLLTTRRAAFLDTVPLADW